MDAATKSWGDVSVDSFSPHPSILDSVLRIKKLRGQYTIYKIKHLFALSKYTDTIILVEDQL